MKKRTVSLIVTGILTVCICAVMNLYLIPEIESATQGVRCFDMNFGYSYKTAQTFLSLLSEEGKRVYLTRQLPLDFFYPLAYGAFFILLIGALLRKKTKLTLIPVFLMLADYCENLCVILMLKSDADALSKTLVVAASAATVVKTVLMYLCFILILMLIVLAARNKKKSGSG